MSALAILILYSILLVVRFRFRSSMKQAARGLQSIHSPSDQTRHLANHFRRSYQATRKHLYRTDRYLLGLSLFSCFAVVFLNVRPPSGDFGFVVLVLLTFAMLYIMVMIHVVRFLQWALHPTAFAVVMVLFKFATLFGLFGLFGMEEAGAVDVDLADMDSFDLAGDVPVDGAGMDPNPPLEDVSGYQRADGTIVDPYQRTAADGFKENNLGYRGE